jgi:hypothetical protein
VLVVSVGHSSRLDTTRILLVLFDF